MDSSNTDVLIVGGGPAGSVAAAALARAGIGCVLMERDSFPRYHIGESLLPSVLTVLDAIDLRSTVERYGFVRKFGGLFRWGPESAPWKLAFGELEGLKNYAFQVIRSEFDELLLRHAAVCGARVLENTPVREVEIGPDGRAHSAIYVSGGVERRIGFNFLIDASGRYGLMANHLLKSRIFHSAFDNIAIWQYWRGGKPTPQVEGGIITEATPLGWIWYIPLHDGTFSVGTVTSRAAAIRANLRDNAEGMYRKVLAASMLASAQLDQATPVGELRIERDYSYHSTSFSGPGYFMAGDAACFIDPVLSSGVHLATMSGLMAAACVRACLLEGWDEAETHGFYEENYQKAFHRFLGFLSAFYDQNRHVHSYFWQDRQLSEQECSATALRRAFVTLVTGEQDLRELTYQQTAQEVVETVIAGRVSENIRLRNSSEPLTSNVHASRRFVAGVDGLFPCDSGEAVNGTYLQLVPHVRLARVATPVSESPVAEMSDAFRVPMS